MRSCGLLAHAVSRDGKWTVLKGREIRVAVQPSANGGASQRRAELLHSGDCSAKAIANRRLSSAGRDLRPRSAGESLPISCHSACNKSPHAKTAS
jgi:hypothetical protein